MLFMVFLPALILIFSILAKRLAGKSVSKMIYLVPSWTLNLNSVNRAKSILIQMVLFFYSFVIHCEFFSGFSCSCTGFDVALQK